MSTFSRPNFTDARLWEQAMTHSSFKNEHATIDVDNERLEFLGDAILTFIGAEYLYDLYPNRPEGELSPIRSALVDQDQLCQFARQLDLDQSLRLGKGEEQQGGRCKPKNLCSVFEAMIGAYFLDTGRNAQAVSQYVKPLFDTVDTNAIGKTTIKDYKSPLQEFVQKQFDGAKPEYVTISHSGPDNERQYEMEVQIVGKAYGRGIGVGKKRAEQAAAKRTLEMFRESD